MLALQSSERLAERAPYGRSVVPSGSQGQQTKGGVQAPTAAMFTASRGANDLSGRTLRPDAARHSDLHRGGIQSVGPQKLAKGSIHLPPGFAGPASQKDSSRPRNLMSTALTRGESWRPVRDWAISRIGGSSGPLINESEGKHES